MEKTSNVTSAASGAKTTSYKGYVGYALFVVLFVVMALHFFGVITIPKFSKKKPMLPYATGASDPNKGRDAGKRYARQPAQNF
jgi:cytochrome b